MRPLGEALSHAGFPVVGVELPGHGSEPGALASVGYREWLACVDDAIGELRREGRQVAIAGMSMGALLALLAAAERGDDVRALVLCGTAIRLRPWVRWLPLLERVPGVARRWPMLPRRGERGISDAAARADSPTYETIPWRAVRELLALRHATEAALPRVRRPTLALHGRGDRSVPVAVLDELRRALGEGWFEAHVLERSWHVITMDVERERVAELVVDFLSRVEADRRA